MRILISNDDGYRAPGIQCLAEQLSKFSSVQVVAPDRDRSGASHSLTLDSPLRATAIKNGFIVVDGTPTDCVHLALTGLLTQEPDLVVSGINSGANLGDDVLYSGTVAAAMEGRFLGSPAMAVSLVGGQRGNFLTAARVVELLLNGLSEHPIPVNTILNINVPDVDWEEIKGLKATRLGNRHKAEAVIHAKDPRGRPIYWIGSPGAEQDAGPGTDFYAVNAGFVSVTPLQVDLSNHGVLSDLSSWVDELTDA